MLILLLICYIKIMREKHMLSVYFCYPSHDFITNLILIGPWVSVIYVDENVI